MSFTNQHATPATSKKSSLDSVVHIQTRLEPWKKLDDDEPFGPIPCKILGEKEHG
jgi:hypothetical protein